jgi:hypothetical protein
MRSTTEPYVIPTPDLLRYDANGESGLPLDVSVDKVFGVGPMRWAYAVERADLPAVDGETAMEVRIVDLQSGAPQYFMVGVGYLWDTVPDASASTSSPTSIPEMSRTFCGVPDAGRDSATPASRSAGTPTTFGGGNERTRHRDRNPSNSRARHRHRRSDLRRPDPDHVVGRPPVKGRS